MNNIPEKNSYYTYILKCRDGSLYTGWTNNLVNRLETHNCGKGGKYTASRRPVELVYYEISATREEAMSREWHIKQLSSRTKKRLIGEEVSGTFVYVADTSFLSEEKLFDELLQTVSLTRQEAVNKIRRQKEKQLSLGAALLFNRACEELGLNPRGLVMEKGQNGKPCIVNLENVYFNLSHSGDRAMCVVSDHPVGCDVELVKKPAPKVADRFFNECEKELLRNTGTEEEYRDLFFRIWTLKESFVKCTGTGLTYALDKFSVIPGDKVEIIQNYDDRKYILKELHVEDEEYRYSLCVAGPDELKDTGPVDSPVVKYLPCKFTN